MTLLDAFETSKMTMLKFDTLPGTDVLTYLAERATYSEQMVAEITAQVLDALSYIHWRGKVSEKADDSKTPMCSIANCIFHPSDMDQLLGCTAFFFTEP